MANPTLSDVLDAVREIHGDVKVALDRTEKHAETLLSLATKVDGHGLEMAKAKGQASVIGVVGSGLLIGAVELAKWAFGQGHH